MEAPPNKKISSGIITGDSKAVVKKNRLGKKYQTGACCYCKRRRKKCDGQYPSCSTCKQIDITCTMKDAASGREVPRNYVETLENEISRLEDALIHTRRAIETEAQRGTLNDGPGERTADHSEEIDTEFLGEQEDKDLTRDVGYITFAAAAEPRYLGASSAYSIAKVITHSIHYYRQNNKAYTIGEVKLINSVNSDTEEPQEQLLALELRKPSKETGTKLLKAYHRGVQYQYPFLDWPWVSECFEKVMNTEKADDVSLFFINMIYAIGTQLTEGVSSTLSSVQAKAYYNKAFEHINSIIEDTSIRTVQVYLILGIFSQKMPSGSSIWQTTGLAIRTSVALGLHRSTHSYRKRFGEKEMDITGRDLRSRVFWSAYSLERINGLVLGRPFGLSDVDIDVPLPELGEYVVANHVFKLRKIQSSICVFVYGPRHFNEDLVETNVTRQQIMLELNNWKATFPVNRDAKCTWETDNWSTISYHNSILLLLRPIVLEVSEMRGSASTSSIEWFKIFTKSASAICLNYKELHSIQKLSYTWLALHCVFIAGVSFLYCIWLDCSMNILQWRRKSTIYDTISACSNILYVLAERWKSANVFRNSFEQMSKAILSKLENEGEILSEDETNFYCDSIPAANEDVEGCGQKQKTGIDLCPRGTSNANESTYDPQEQRASLGQTDGVSFVIPSSVSSNSSPHAQADKRDPHTVNSSIWDFLNDEGDQFLRAIFYDIEERLTTPR